MGKVDRLRNRVEPFVALFMGYRHCTCCMHHLTLPADPASFHACPYLVIVSSIRNEDAWPTFSYLGMLFIYGWPYSSMPALSQLYVTKKYFLLKKVHVLQDQKHF